MAPSRPAPGSPAAGTAAVRLPVRDATVTLDGVAESKGRRPWPSPSTTTTCSSSAPARVARRRRSARPSWASGSRVVERRHMVGGVCVNTGTIPSKTLREAVLYLTGLSMRELYGAVVPGEARDHRSGPVGPHAARHRPGDRGRPDAAVPQPRRPAHRHRPLRRSRTRVEVARRRRRTAWSPRSRS